MKLTIDILRQKDSASAPYKQTIELDARPDDTVATLLNTINARDDLKDSNGEPVGTIHWQCSCLQKKCGACAMRINGDPALACDTKLSACKRGKLSLEPLRKFPTVRDLIVDRSLMMENLRTIQGCPGRSITGWSSLRIIAARRRIYAMTRRAAFNAAAVLRSARILCRTAIFLERRRLCRLQGSFRSSRKAKNTI